MICKAQTKVFFVLFECCDIHLIPLRFTSIKFSASIPVKWSCIHTWRYITHTNRSRQIFISNKADIYPFAIHSFEHIIFDKLHNAFICIEHQFLSYNTSHWASKRNLYCQISSFACKVSYIKLCIKITFSDQLFTFHFIYMFSSSQVQVLVKHQFRS